MNQDLGLSAAQFGFASGIFFLGYIILEVPSNLALHNFGARVWLARIIVTWGIVANRTTQIKKPAHIAALIPRERLASQLRPSLSRQNPRKYLRPKSRQAIFEPEGE